jgi:hypothetical protein
MLWRVRCGGCCREIQVNEVFVDFHLHSDHTDGVEVDLDAMLDRAAEAGLDGVCITDVAATRHAPELIRAGAAAGVEVFVGLELQTDHGALLGFAPAIDSFYLREEWRELTTVGTPRAARFVEIFEGIGGATIAAYPYDPKATWATGDRIFKIQGLAGIEAWVPRVPTTRNALGVEAAAAMGIGVCGGTDFRGGDLSKIGEAATLLARPAHSQAEFVEIVRSGDFWAVSLGVKVEDPKPKTEEERARDAERSRPRGRPGGDRGRRSDGDRGGRGGGRRREGGGRGRSRD